MIGVVSEEQNIDLVLFECLLLTAQLIFMKK